MTSAEVIVVGAGPTGLLLAGDLAAAGLRTVVLERRTEESNLTRAFGVHARTLEELDARGLADELVEQGAAVSSLRLFDRVLVDLSLLPSRFPYLLITPQFHTERLLERRAREHGAEIVTGATVTALRQDDDGVRAEIDGGGLYTARYLVGADGVGSTVRKAIGQPYPGRSVVKSIMLADVRMSRPPADVITVNAIGDAFAFIAPFGDGWYRIFCWNRRNQVGDDQPLEFDEVQEVTRRALGDDFGAHDPRWMSRFHSDERQVPQYRVGQVFLAGDAAHCHSPAGGLGMNTGIQDAANLGWKLAAAVQGWAPDGLLDTYQSERHPVGRQVLRSSGAIIRMAMLRSGAARAVRGAVGETLLHRPAVAERAMGMLSGIGIAYDAPRGAHPSVGRRLGDVPLADGGRLYEALRSGRFVVLGERTEAVADRPHRVVSAVPAEPMPLSLVRPDGYVAWATDETDPGRRTVALREVLADWCGAPETVTR